jgi:hypothetical protein
MHFLSLARCFSDQIWPVFTAELTVERDCIKRSHSSLWNNRHKTCFEPHIHENIVAVCESNKNLSEKQLIKNRPQFFAISGDKNDKLVI